MISAVQLPTVTVEIKMKMMAKRNKRKKKKSYALSLIRLHSRVSFNYLLYRIYILFLFFSSYFSSRSNSYLPQFSLVEAELPLVLCVCGLSLAWVSCDFYFSICIGRMPRGLLLREKFCGVIALLAKSLSFFLIN